MAVQKGIIVTLFLTSSILCASFVLSFPYWCKRQLNPSSAASNNENGSVPEPRSDPDFSPYILLLEDEPKLPNRVLDKISSGVNQFILTGKRKQPKSLTQLLMKSTGLKGLMIEFDKDQLPNLNAKEPPNWWTLPLITLTSIAIALPNNEADLAAELQRSVREGLLYASRIEKSPGTHEKLTYFRNAADPVWVGGELYLKWLNVDLLQMARKNHESVDALYCLSDVAEHTFKEFKRKYNGSLMENPLNWPFKLIAANSMYRISQTILLGFREDSPPSDVKLFDQISIMIADIMAACLTNLPRVITVKC